MVSSLMRCGAVVVMILSSGVCAYDKAPVKIADKSLSRKVLLGGAAAAGLALGKVLYNGPNFNEDVSLAGQTAVITGGNTGLGKETAVKLAALGAKTMILCRNPTKAANAAAEIKQRSKSDNVQAIELDLASMESIRKCASALHRETDSIDILVNNAGVMAIPTRETTSDGFEKQLGINHLGHFALTSMLWDLIARQPQPQKERLKRIINVSSSAHMLARIDRNDLLLDKSPESYQPWLAYGNSKMANIHFTREMARRLQSSIGAQEQQQNQNIVPLTCHPGACRTELGRYLFDPSGKIPLFAYPLVALVAPPALYLTKSSEEGAQTQIFLAASRTVTKADAGRFFDNSAVASTNAEAQDAAEAAWLWEESARLTGAKFPF